jgi:hypothetical protein
MAETLSFKSPKAEVHTEKTCFKQLASHDFELQGLETSVFVPDMKTEMSTISFT